MEESESFGPSESLKRRADGADGLVLVEDDMPFGTGEYTVELEVR